MNVEQVREYLNQFNFDIRNFRDGRFIDQKCTPDIVCLIADSVVNFVESTGLKTFTVRNIWDNPYFIQNIMEIFGKPHPDDPKARSEYDRVIQQPLRLLESAEILSCEKVGNTNHYSVKNSDILEFISIKDYNAFQFLYLYFHKLISDSGILGLFERYKDAYLNNKSPKQRFGEMKAGYENFINLHTPIKGTYEPRRIFSKLVNTYALANKIPGTKMGRMSNTLTTFSDLLYNKVNWRDVGKEKHLTRQEYEDIAQQPKAEAITKYLIQKAKKQISRKYETSEVNDQYAASDSFQVHHIFPENEYPHLAAYLENLINLSPTQHYSMAHPKNKTHMIDRDYQLICLLAKSSNIQISLNAGEDFYNKGNFVFVINEGIYEELVQEDFGFDVIEQRLIHFYNSN